ncbi:pyridoxal phosphate-dependent transferase [Sparassis latifolia]
MDIEAFRKAGYAAIDRICDYYSTLQGRPVVPSVQPGFLTNALPTSPPEVGEDFEVIADDFQKLIIPGLTHWQHPSFFAFFPTAGTFESMLGDLLSSSVSNPGFNWLASPACTELEMTMMDWCAKVLGLSDEFLNSSQTGGGVIQTSSSDALLVITVAARARYLREHPGTKLEDLVMYVSSQTHSMGVKTGLVFGLACRVLEVSADDEYGLRGAVVKKALEEDLANGKHPFLVVGSVGTTSSGAIDRVGEIGETLREYPSIWFHVDAAWAGVALSCPENREIAQLASINKYVDSLGTNFHKWGLVNFDATMLWVRSREDLTEALEVTPPFLRTKQGDARAVVDYRNWNLGLGRRFRSLKVWFVLRSYGVEGFQKHIRKGIALNNHFVSLVSASPLFSLVAPPSFALTVFRLTPQTVLPVSTAPLTESLLNDVNRALYVRITARPEILLTQTVLNGTVCLRFAVGATRTETEHVEMAWQLIQEEAGVVVEELKQRLASSG